MRSSDSILFIFNFLTRYWAAIFPVFFILLLEILLARNSSEIDDTLREKRKKFLKTE